jgi:hypothetical protein
VLTVVHYKAITYGKITLMSISLHIDILHIKLVQNLFNQNCLLLQTISLLSCPSSSSSFN